jgi:hypothetical protein
MFVFCPNLLMGEFERSGLGRRNGLAWAIADIVTPTKFYFQARWFPSLRWNALECPAGTIL